MKKIIAAVVVLVVVALQVVAISMRQGGTAVVSLKPVTEVEKGQLVILELGDDTVGSNPVWKVTPDLGENFRAEGRRAFVVFPESRTYKIFVAVAQNSTLDMKEYDVVAGASKAKRTATAKVGFPQTVDSWVAQVQSPGVDDERTRLAQSFETIASLIDAGVLKEPQQIVEATAKSNATALGASKPLWDATFFASLKAELGSRAKAGSLTTPEQHAAMWREIAAGLK